MSPTDSESGPSPDHLSGPATTDEATTGAPRPEAPVVSIPELLGERREVVIEHLGSKYRLFLAPPDEKP